MRASLVGVLIAALAACSSSPTDPGGGNPGGGNPGGGNPGGGNTVTLSGASFTPSTLTVATGTTVTWRNDSGIPHTITPDGHTAWTAVTTGAANGNVLSVSFTTAGTFPYECDFHSGMTGSIVVQ